MEAAWTSSLNFYVFRMLKDIVFGCLRPFIDKGVLRVDFFSAPFLISLIFLSLSLSPFCFIFLRFLHTFQEKLVSIPQFVIERNFKSIQELIFHVFNLQCTLISKDMYHDAMTVPEICQKMLFRGGE